MKRFVAAAGGAIAFLALAAAIVGVRWLHEAPPAGAAVEFAVTAGEPFSAVARRMEEAGLVVSERRARIVARLSGRDREVQAGLYRLERGLSPVRLLDDLVSGRVVLRRFMVPEGARLVQIAEAVRDSLGIPAEEFVAAARDAERRARIGTRAADLEGYLFPDTYFFPHGATAGDVVDGMLARFEQTWAELRGTPPAGLDRHGVVTLASIVEAETPLREEKPRVAAVYLNRLRDGWRLQADPTVRYGLGYWAERLYYKHLEIDTPYNTYRNAGLPPGPIGSPGAESLRAVLAPQEPCHDFFFVASGDGGHVFSRTKNEHDRAVRALRAASAG